MPEPPLPRVSIAVLRALPFGVPGTRLDAGPKDAGGPIELNRIDRQVERMPRLGSPAPRRPVAPRSAPR